VQKGRTRTDVAGTQKIKVSPEFDAVQIGKYRYLKETDAPIFGVFNKLLTTLMMEPVRIFGTMIGELRYNTPEECMYSTVLNSCCCERCLNTTLQYTQC